GDRSGGRRMCPATAAALFAGCKAQRLLRGEEDRVLLAPVGLHLATHAVVLPHAEAKLDVDALADAAHPVDLDAREETLAEEDRGGEAGVHDAHAVATPSLADQPGTMGGDDACLSGQCDRQLAR